MICKSKKKGEGKVVTLWKKKKDIFASIADMIKKKCRDLSKKFLSSADKIVMLTDAPLCSDFESSTVIDLIEGWIDLKPRSCLPPFGIIAGQLAPWILWSLWIARNNLVFEYKIFTSEDALLKAILAATKWKNGQHKYTSEYERKNSEIFG